LLEREHLHILGHGRNPLCPLTEVETDHEKQAIGRRLGQLLKMARAASSVAPAMVRAPAAVAALMGDPPPSNNLMHEALVRQVDGVSSGSYGG
jgi:hypothetical protein